LFISIKNRLSVLTPANTNTSKEKPQQTKDKDEAIPGMKEKTKNQQKPLNRKNHSNPKHKTTLDFWWKIQMEGIPFLPRATRLTIGYPHKAQALGR